MSAFKFPTAWRHLLSLIRPQFLFFFSSQFGKAIYLSIKGGSDFGGFPISPPVYLCLTHHGCSRWPHRRTLKVCDDADISLDILLLKSQDMVNGIMLNVKKLIKDLKSKEFPEARAYLRILGEELGFVRLHDIQLLGKLLLDGVHTLPGIPQMVSRPGAITSNEISPCPL